MSTSTEYEFKARTPEGVITWVTSIPDHVQYIADYARDEIESRWNQEVVVVSFKRVES